MKTKWVHKPAALLFIINNVRLKRNRKIKDGDLDSARPLQSALTLEWATENYIPCSM